MTDDVHKILLAPIDAPEHSVDSTLTDADCGHRCWIGPESIRVVGNPLVRTETVCWRCVDPDAFAAAVEAQGGLLALPGVRDALTRHVGVAAADQLWARFRVREHDPAEGAP